MLIKIKQLGVLESEIFGIRLVLESGISGNRPVLESGILGNRPDLSGIMTDI